ncbi:MAG TPA: glutamine synthetase family protein [Pseudomonadales bacterium]|nr:glutamine synthetase family protein [Pseudomonadales bacterium]
MQEVEEAVERIAPAVRQENAERLAAALARFREGGITRVKLAVTDVDGVLRGKYIGLDKLASLVEGTAGFCDCVLGWDIADQLYDNVAFTGWHTGFPDARFRLDAATERHLPGEDTPFFLADFVADDVLDEGVAGTRLHPICPRSRLKAVLARAGRMGFAAKMGFEYEFFVFRETPDSLRAKGYRDLQPISPGNFGYSMLRATAQADLFTGLMDHANAIGTPVEGLHCETGPGVWEAALAVADGIEAADRASLFKTFAKAFFQQHDLVATFMAKWSMDYPGQSGHLHVSLQDSGGVPLFHAADGPDGMSLLQRQFVAGVRRYMRELTALYAPTVNSYTRLVPGYWAPTAATWGVENRTCAIRVIPGSTHSQRVEFRAAGADANPYLAAAAVLAAGLQGIDDGLDPSDPVTGNAYAVQDALPPELHLPTHLRDAAALLRGSELARSWFGDAFVDHFAATREWEAREYERHVNDWQLARYFEII